LKFSAFLLCTVCIGFAQPSYTVCEGDPNLFFVCVDLVSGELGRDVTVTVQTEDDSALCTYSVKYLALVYFQV